jgi:ABC-type glycerol-3-phosphate transport system substrate-binding protein
MAHEYISAPYPAFIKGLKKILVAQVKNKRKIAYFLALLSFLFFLQTPLVRAATDEGDDVDVADGFDPWKTQESNLEDVVDETGYLDVKDEYLSLANEEETLAVKATDALVSLENRDGEKIDLNKGESGGIQIPAGTKAVFKIQAPEKATWHINLLYRITSKNIVDLKVNVDINDAKQFYEAYDIALPAAWRTQDQSLKIDQYNNQVYSSSELLDKEIEHTLNHDMFYLSTPLLFAFEKGENTLSLENNEISYELIEIRLQPKETIDTYKSYQENNLEDSKETPKLADVEPLILEGEGFTEKNRVHIRGERSKDYNYHPYDPKSSLINVLAPTMWQNPGDAVSYAFEVPEDGYYRIGFRVQQDQKRDMPVYKNILIDGRIPFDALESYAFPFTGSAVQTEFLNADGEEFLFYLSQGKHEIQLISTASNYFGAYEVLSQVIRQMNQLTLDIRTITGNRIDENRQWNIEQYIPDIREQLQELIDSLNLVYQDLSHLSGQENSTTWNNLRIIADQLELYLEETKGLDKFVNNLDNFSQNDGSMAQQISALIDQMLLQPLSIDQVYIAGEDLSALPGKLNFFQRSYLGLEKFVQSFNRNTDADLALDKDALNIWVNRPVTHIDVLREMINQEYPNKDIKINLSAMPDENRLLLAIIGGNAPDGVLGLSSGKPYDFALRGAAYDLRNFDDFDESVSDFTAEMFLPFAYDEGIYAFPETTTFHVLFYRTDIMQSLNLDIPQTWEDLVGIVPALDRHGMNIQTMIAANDAYKPFAATVPIIQQNKGEIYSDDGMTVSFNHPNTLEAFDLLTNLYVRYNLPYRIVNFYNNFKSGVTPIGVSELNTYTLLKYAAPEIRGQWAIAPNIGIKDENGEFINTQPVVTSAVMITQQSEKKQEMWEFMKWWMDDQTQLQYGNELQMRFGKEYIWSSANLETIKNAPYFEQEDRDIIYEQILNAKEFPRHPAYFQVERELSNAWNSVVFDGITVREALDRAALSSNRIMATKLQEFGYIDNEGNTLKEFIMPNVREIETYGNFAKPSRDLS